MIYVYCLITQDKYDAVNGENLELQSLFQDINCPLGQGISFYLKAEYLQKMKRKTAFVKAEKYIMKSATKFEMALEVEGIEQCIKLLKKINANHEMIHTLQGKIDNLRANYEKEMQERDQEERIDLNKHSDDIIKNMLLNPILYSFLKKQYNLTKNGASPRVST